MAADERRAGQRKRGRGADAHGKDAGIRDAEDAAEQVARAQGGVQRLPDEAREVVGRDFGGGRQDARGQVEVNDVFRRHAAERGIAVGQFEGARRVLVDGEEQLVRRERGGALPKAEDQDEREQCAAGHAVASSAAPAADPADEAQGPDAGEDDAGRFRDGHDGDDLVVIGL